MYDGPFRPTGPTVLVGITSVQAPTNDGTGQTSYRVRAMLSTQQYLTWAPFTTVNPNVPVTAPTAGVPSTNTLGFAGLSTETVVLPMNCWLRADAAAAFEVTPGEGL